jgi:hypothetical protein
MATVTNYSCSTHFLVNVVQKKHAQENMKIAVPREGGQTVGNDL